jgi:hypothetical protein
LCVPVIPALGRQRQEEFSEGLKVSGRELA